MPSWGFAVQRHHGQCGCWEMALQGAGRPLPLLGPYVLCAGRAVWGQRGRKIVRGEELRGVCTHLHTY
jgi:hypothetical protein